MSIILVMLAIAACIALWLALTLLVQVVAAILPGPSRDEAAGPARPHVAVVVPAHDESAGIAHTLRAILAQLQPGDRLVVVADNCIDDTAAIAAAQGAEVLVRRDAQRRGKGYALDCGMRYLEQAPPDVVIVVDADCELGGGAIDHLARRAVALGAPIQALYLMHGRSDRASARLAEFAWIIKNQVRPLGYARLGLPCQLMGTGMAFPWWLACRLPLANGHLVEDMKMGVEAALLGHPAALCYAARVGSQFPDRAEAAASQRTRWEHGHLSVICSELPRLLHAAMARFDVRLLALALDLAIPPLALFVILEVALMCASIIAAWLGGQTWLAILGTMPLVLSGFAISLAWLGWGRQTIPFRILLAAPCYVLRKLPLYGRFLLNPQRNWIRTERD